MKYTQHYFDWNFPEDKTFCGLKLISNFNSLIHWKTSWNKVTCKNCLKIRRLRKINIKKYGTST